MVPKKLTSPQHPFVKKLVQLRKDKSFRKEEKKVLVLGTKMVEELALAKIPIQTLIVQEDKASAFSFQASETVLVTFELLKKITGLPHPEPVAAVIWIPPFQDLSKASKLLVLDGLSDPGNVGTLIRTALALGWDGVMLLDNTCDPFNEKALRAAKGATFRIPLAVGSWNDFVFFIKKNSFYTLLADMEGSDVRSVLPTYPLALVLSKESKGAREEAKHLFPKVKVPMQGSMESLNVASAGAILLFNLTRSHV